MKNVLIFVLVAILLVGCGNDLETTLEGDTVVTSGTMTDGGDGSTVGEVSEDSCLIGDWKMTNFSEYLEAMVAGAMDGSPVGGEITSTDSGDLIISFDEETMSMSDNDFEVTATMMGITVPVEIDASGEAGYELSDGQIVNKGSSVDVEGRSGGGAGYRVDLDSLTSRAVDYDCDGDSLVWMAGDDFEVDLAFERL